MTAELAAYQAQPHVVRPVEGRPCVATMATLRHVVMSWLELAQASGEFKMLSSGEILVTLCPHATALCRTTSTRCAVYVGFWKGGFNLRQQGRCIIGQHGGYWTVATTCILFVQRMASPRSMTNSKRSSRPRTSLSRDMEWQVTGAR